MWPLVVLMRAVQGHIAPKGEDMHLWEGYVSGPAGTPYEVYLAKDSLVCYFAVIKLYRAASSFLIYIFLRSTRSRRPRLGRGCLYWCCATVLTDDRFS